MESSAVGLIGGETPAELNWSLTSQDYSRHRTGYPDSFFQLLRHMGIGLPGQRILDVGSGTGNLAIPFARQGAAVTAVDQASGQIDAARVRADAEHLKIRFIVSGAEDAPVETGHFDVVTASMCWGYLDKERIGEQLKRVLRADGLLLICSLIWRSGDSEITRVTEQLIDRYNGLHAKRSGRRDSSGNQDWVSDDFQLKTFHRYEAALPFTRESWRGRIRASKWIGAALPPEKVMAFDRELAELLNRHAPAEFEINHTVRLQIFQRG